MLAEIRKKADKEFKFSNKGNNNRSSEFCDDRKPKCYGFTIDHNSMMVGKIPILDLLHTQRWFTEISHQFHSGKLEVRLASKIQILRERKT